WVRVFRDPGGEEPELRFALAAIVALVLGRFVGGDRQGFDEHETPRDFGRVSSAKPMDEDRELEAADREAAQAVSALSLAVANQVLVREGEDVGWESAQAKPPTGAGVPLTPAC